ncbi:hypothetical protein [Bythopirellula goksoeyrii]|uniref:Autotransporter-associated beta strand repeat protein n=1 Tax=Bythopirellula goksoeyrii TaxID=1400387 RepID=A0A5B9QFK5_9BACT|nr:hypothetical protein [Bythopirellula goksoeyrii]QEG37798.1 hypothetical protein Pr1d_51450 [Bythopirellula goksoeyrii]
MYTRTLFLTIVITGYLFGEIARSDDVFWDGETSSDWHTGTNWQPQCSGQFCLQSPPGVGDNAILQNVGPLGSDLASLSDDVNIDILAIRDGVTVNTNGHTLLALVHTYVEDNGTALIVPDSPNSSQAFFTFALDIADGGSVELGGLGQAAATVEIGGPQSTIGAGSSLAGNGTIKFDNFQGNSETVLLDNSGTIRPQNGFLSLLPVGASRGVFDLDGANEDGVLDVDDGSFLATSVRLNVYGPLADSFTGILQIGQDDQAHFAFPWRLGSSNQVLNAGLIEMNGDNGTATLSGEALEMFHNNAKLNVLSGKASLLGPVTVTRGQVNVAPGATIHFSENSWIRENGEFVTGDHYDLIVDKLLRIDDPHIDWDSPSPGSHTTTINSGGRLEINSNTIDPGNPFPDNEFRGTLEVNGGELRMDICCQWVFDGRMMLQYTNGSEATIQGAPFILGDGFDTGNDALVEVSGPGASVFNAPVVFRGDAELQMDYGSQLELLGDSDFEQGVQISGPGELENLVGTMTFAGGIAISAPLINSATLVVGGDNQVGVLTTAGFTQTDAPSVLGVEESLNLELQSTTLGDFDQLIVNGPASLDGMLAVDWLGASMPSLGDSFPILSATSVTGTFEELMLPPVASGHAWSIQYNPTSVVLEVVDPTQLTADFDQDGDVDGNDFLIWQRGGSPNGINSGDLALWQSHYGAPITAATAAVPEPRPLVLLSLLLVSLRGQFLSRIAW